MELETLFNQLRKLCENVGVGVIQWHQSPTLAGGFRPLTYGQGGQIYLCDDPEARVYETALAILAHEIGHFLSWILGERPERYESARRIFMKEDDSGIEMTAEDRAAILAEEENAWRHGRELLGCWGYETWDAFDAERERSIGAYREALSGADS